MGLGLNTDIFCFILLFTSSSPCRKDQFAVSYFSTSLIVLIQVYNWEIRHHSLVCCCGLAEILSILVLPIMAYTGRLRPNRVPFSGFRYMKGRVSPVSI